MATNEKASFEIMEAGGCRMKSKYSSVFIGAIAHAIQALGGIVTSVQDRTIIGSYKGNPYSLTYAPFPTGGQIGGVMDALRKIGAYQRVERKAS